MRIFVVGATGALGARLIPRLTERGHEVIGSSRSAQRAERVRRGGAEAAVVDILDRDAVMDVVPAARPDVIVHEATALAGWTDIRKFKQGFALTNRLRTEGTDHLLAAARTAGSHRFVAQSFGGWPSTPEGGPVKTEEDPLDPNPPAAMRTTVSAIRYLEAAVTGAEGMDGLALRYGGFYGPGTSLGPGGVQTEMVCRRRFPIVGRGTGVMSLIHVDDAAAATIAAIEGGSPGIYNIVDDEPAPVSAWLPVLAEAVGAPPPRHVPTWLARLLVGEVGVALMTEARGASNAKAKRELDWKLEYPTWRYGFRESLQAEPGDVPHSAA
jgi:2-alkyl-3-oxoalkanoate reductase